jgi:hypothetical protein
MEFPVMFGFYLADESRQYSSIALADRYSQPDWRTAVTPFPVTTQLIVLISILNDS